VKFAANPQRQKFHKNLRFICNCKKGKGSTSFCEQKEAKKLYLFLSRACSAPREAEQKSFLVLFFKKELLHSTYLATLEAGFTSKTKPAASAPSNALPQSSKPSAAAGCPGGAAAA
jgi:hypothetical protein